jgi:hypothetical protein
MDDPSDPWVSDKEGKATGEMMHAENASSTGRHPVRSARWSAACLCMCIRYDYPALLCLTRHGRQSGLLSLLASKVTIQSSFQQRKIPN